MRAYIVSLVIFLFIGKSAGDLRCYACSFSSADSDKSCLTITESTVSVDCPYQYCTIQRQEYLDPPGEIASFLRGCSDSPDHLNHEVVDSNFRTFYRACTSDLCNIGDGIQSIVGGELNPNPAYNGTNLLVPGTGGNTATLRCANIIALFLVLIIQYIAT